MGVHNFTRLNLSYLGHILLTPRRFTDFFRADSLTALRFCDLTYFRTRNQSRRAHQGLQEMSRVIFVLAARLGHKTQNTFRDAALLRDQIANISPTTGPIASRPEPLERAWKAAPNSDLTRAFGDLTPGLATTE
jgi:hypothetical protein